MNHGPNRMEAEVEAVVSEVSVRSVRSVRWVKVDVGKGKGGAQSGASRVFVLLMYRGAFV